MKTPDPSSEKQQREREAVFHALLQKSRDEFSASDRAEVLDIADEKTTCNSSKPSGFKDDIKETLKYLSLSGARKKMACLAIVIAGLVTGLVLLRSRDFTIRTPLTWQGTSSARLPDTLHFQIGKNSASLRAASYTLNGRIGGEMRGLGDLTTLDATFDGHLGDGTPVRFAGFLVLTNAPGVVNVHRRSDFVGAALVGDLKVNTNAPVAINQPYLP